jgi:hypothetical protein
MATKAALLAAFLLLALPASAGAATRRASTLKECAHYSDHVYEACFAFAINCTALSMVPYFKYGRSPNAAWAAAARNRLESRYSGQARSKLKALANSWPVGENYVRFAKLQIISARSSLATNTATLRIRWTWAVISSDKRLFSELDKLHTITLKRGPGLLLHKWVVTAIR